MTGNWEEDIFEHRNKLYGSYYLRRKYKKYLLTGFILAVLFITTPLLLLNYCSQKKVLEEELPVIISVDLSHPMDVDDLLSEPPAPAKIPNLEKEVGLPVVTDSATEMKKPAFNEQNKNKDSTVVIENKDKNKSADVKDAEDDTSSFIHVDRLPQFLAGNDVFINFVRKNFIIPDEVIKKRIKGKIVVQLFISSTGDVLNVKLVTGIYPAADNEALRVMSIPKKWKPAIRAGKAVPFRLNIPIKF
jgi:protein TonB